MNSSGVTTSCGGMIAGKRFMRNHRAVRSARSLAVAMGCLNSRRLGGLTSTYGVATTDWQRQLHADFQCDLPLRPGHQGKRRRLGRSSRRECRERVQKCLPARDCFQPGPVSSKGPSSPGFFRPAEHIRLPASLGGLCRLVNLATRINWRSSFARKGGCCCAMASIADYCLRDRTESVATQGRVGRVVTRPRCQGQRGILILQPEAQGPARSGSTTGKLLLA